MWLWLCNRGFRRLNVGKSFINYSRKFSEFPSVVCISPGVLLLLVFCLTVHMDILKCFHFLVEHLLHLILRPLNPSSIFSFLFNSWYLSWAVADGVLVFLLVILKGSSSRTGLRWYSIMSQWCKKVQVFHLQREHRSLLLRQNFASGSKNFR